MYAYNPSHIQMETTRAFNYIMQGSSAIFPCANDNWVEVIEAINDWGYFLSLVTFPNAPKG